MIKYITLEGIEEGDEVSADIGTIRGTLKDVKAGNYTSVTLPELRLTGKDKENYILVQPTDEIPLTKAVNVAKSSGLQIEEQNKSYLYLKDQEERISLREILPVDCGNAQYAAPEMTGKHGIYHRTEYSRRYIILYSEAGGTGQERKDPDQSYD